MTSATLIRESATPDHRAAARELATALARSMLEQSGKPFDGLPEAFRRHLDARECGMVAWAALKACERKHLGAVLALAIPDHAGMPEPPFDLADVMLDAALWATAASEEERKAYAMAALSHMSEEERHGIVRALEGRGAA